jgi:hypothetical protein
MHAQQWVCLNMMVNGLSALKKHQLWNLDHNYELCLQGYSLIAHQIVQLICEIGFKNIYVTTCFIIWKLKCFHRSNPFIVEQLAFDFDEFLVTINEREPKFNEKQLQAYQEILSFVT